ncbi:MAG TPA: hypothetical protein ENK57_26305 [Polyangiaceae bacterium]|nr:hypothetical protein [Polyangiaceae bacterium]
MASSVKRPRFWVPGVLWVNEERELTIGKHVGYNGHGKAFSASAIGCFMSLRDLRHRLWLVERKDLDPQLVDEHAIILPETLLDPDRQPHARRWLSEQPLICVSGTKLERLLDAGLRVYTVEHGVEAEDELVVSAMGGERAEWLFRGRCPDLVPIELRDQVHKLATRTTRREVRELVDRTLNIISRGTLREASVVNAYAARALVEPGYGYYGATDGTAAPVERVQRDVRGLESLFAQVYERAGPMREEAEEIAKAVAGVGVDDERIDLPVYGGAHRLFVEEYVIPLATDDDEDGPRWIFAGEPRESLLYPSEVRWVVDRVKMWSPKLPADLERELTKELVTRKAPPAWVALSLVGVLLAILVLGLVLGEPLP